MVLSTFLIVSSGNLLSSSRRRLRCDEVSLRGSTSLVVMVSISSWNIHKNYYRSIDRFTSDETTTRSRKKDSQPGLFLNERHVKDSHMAARVKQHRAHCRYRLIEALASELQYISATTITTTITTLPSFSRCPRWLPSEQNQMQNSTVVQEIYIF